MVTISKNEDIITVIVSFAVEPENQQKLIDAIIFNSENVMSKKEGFLSSNVHKSLDGKQIVNYAQWKSRALYEMAINFLNPEEVKIGERILELGNANWHLYKLVNIIGKDSLDISKSNEIKTVINIFSVEPDNQAKLINLWDEFLSNVAKKHTGFFSAAIHRSIDGKRVVSYSQWKSEQDVQQVLSDFSAIKYLDQQQSISQNNANFYEIV